MKILAIETSCDETAVAVVEAQGDENSAEFRVLGNALLSQIELHRPYGGVYPTLAKREHQKNLPHILDAALKDAEMEVKDVDVIAVTTGPGLEPALWVGIEFAKTLAEENGKPLVPVNHMEGHVLSALARKDGGSLRLESIEMPLLALLISGGHTELVSMEKWLIYKLIGQTLDDAVGEAFDKVARLLGLPYPGGPEISKLAEESRTKPKSGHRMSTFGLPRPMINSGTCDFSFAGLKTAVLYLLKNQEKNEKGSGRGGMIYHTAAPPGLSEEKKMQIAEEFENAAADVLWKKTELALEQTNAKTLVIGGGVSANTHIRRVFQENIKQFPKTTLRIPTPDLTTDNAVMIALAAFYRASKKEFANLDALRANGNLSLA
jgi:N6-L-threonylcarbamoyladenine synthase